MSGITKHLTPRNAIIATVIVVVLAATDAVLGSGIPKWLGEQLSQ